MRNIFVTRRRHNLEEPLEKKYITDSLGRQFPIDNHVDEIEVTDTLDGYHEMMKNHDIFGLDTEGNSLNQYYADLLLVQIGVPDITYIIDEGSIDEDYLSMYIDKTYVGHNLQHDLRMIQYLKKVELRRIKDTLTNEQIINRGSGRLNNLNDTYLRRIGKPLPEDKRVRNEFIRMTPKSIFERRHIIYSGFDPQASLQILEAQKPILERFNLTFRAEHIANKCVPILVEMNLNGGTLNKDKWRTNLEENKKEKFRLELELDKIIKEFAKDHVKLRGGIWSSASRIRRREEGEQTGLFGTEITIGNETKKNVSYSSTKQMTKLFTVLKEPLPETEDKKGDRDWSAEPKMKVSFGEPVLEQYKIEHPGSKMIPFINLLLEFKEVEKEINSFGEIFLKEYVKDGKSGRKSKRGYYQPKTDKIHTIYKQEFTKNGRLASGGDKKRKGDLGIGFYNSQQWPKKNKFRNCLTLTDEEIKQGIWISTDDLGSAELVILADKSKDPNLIKYCRGDLHSYLATHSYTRMVQYIVDNMNENRAYDELYQLLKVNRIQKAYKIQIEEDKYRFPTQEESDKITRDRVEMAFVKKALTVDKKTYPDIREPYKNCTYGVTYGAGEDKIAKTLNIAPYYAKLTMEGINIAIPQAMSYLNAVARKGVKEGYIEFNNRTHSRYWFKSWLDAREYGRQLSQKERGAIERFCKNVTMSGTQADMLKEGMVAIDEFVRKEKIYFKWLLQVHDEIVYKHKDKELRPVVEKILVDTCNLYLSVVQMEVDGYTGHMWNKN